MDRNERGAFIQALLAAALFGAVVPLSRILLFDIGPVTLAGLLYLGAGIGGGIIQLLPTSLRRHESAVRKTDLPWLFGIIISGSIIAPILSMIGLSTTPASAASLLLNTELLWTTLFAVLIFHEFLGVRGACAILVVVIGSMIGSYDPNGIFGISLGSLLIICACICWGLDNNLTRMISEKNPSTIIMIKGFIAGIFSITLGYGIHESLPTWQGMIGAMCVGCVGYGFSLFLIIRSLRALGSARTGALFATAPFIGFLLSPPLTGEIPAWNVWICLPLMALGVWLIITEQHCHLHTHQSIQHDHWHDHDDSHHLHNHEYQYQIPHAHVHVHDEIMHDHIHSQDIHHFHNHKTRK